MTNLELQKTFQELLRVNDNIFDIFSSLGKIEKEYKTTTFYKATKKDIYEAFSLYMQSVGQIEYIIALFKNVNDDDLVSILDKIAEGLSMESIMNTMEEDNKELFKQLLPFVQQ